jgi:hypothetical protein
MASAYHSFHRPSLSGARIHPFRAQNARVLPRDRLGDLIRE